MKKILLIIILAFCIFQMVVLATVIDIGSACIDRVYDFVGNRTLINLTNPANAAGNITNIDIWVSVTTTSTKVATFYAVDETHYTARSASADLGAVTAGSAQNFEVDIDVEEGDFIGVWCDADGKVERDLVGGLGLRYILGDQTACENYEFALAANGIMSLYGTGEGAAGWPHKWNTITIGKWNTKEFTKWNDLE